MIELGEPEEKTLVKFKAEAVATSNPTSLVL